VGVPAIGMRHGCEKIGIVDGMDMLELHSS